MRVVLFDSAGNALRELELTGAVSTWPGAIRWRGRSFVVRPLTHTFLEYVETPTSFLDFSAGRPVEGRAGELGLPVEPPDVTALPVKPADLLTDVWNELGEVELTARARLEDGAAAELWLVGPQRLRAKWTRGVGWVARDRFAEAGRVATFAELLTALGWRKGAAGWEPVS